MSLEEDYLMRKVSELEGRIKALEEGNVRVGFVGENDVPESTPVDYSTWTVAQLQEELKKRQDAYAAAEDEEGLEAVSFTSKDTKDVLVSRLEDDDAVSEEE